MRLHERKGVSREKCDVPCCGAGWDGSSGTALRRRGPWAAPFRQECMAPMAFSFYSNLVCPLHTRKHTVLILLNCVLLQGRNEMTNCSMFQFFNGVPPFTLTTYAMTLDF